MTRLRVPLTPLASGRFRVDEATGRYMVRVHRLRTGDRIVAFDPETSTEAQATIESDRLPHVELHVGEVRASAARPHWDVTLVQAVGKGDKPDQVVRDATVLGALRVTLVHTERTVAKAGGPGKRERERRIAVEAARQSGRGDLPEIVGPLSFDAALAATPSDALALVLCFQEGSAPLLDRLREWTPNQPLYLLVGPEGGFSAEEVRYAALRGYRPTSLGVFVMRTETAATVALGVAQSYAVSALPGERRGGA